MMASNSLRRVTVDVDGVDRWDACVKMLIAHNQLLRAGAVAPRVDLTRKGFHLVGWSLEDPDYLRLLAGDDRNRIRADEGPLSRQILFSRKGGFEVRRGIVV